jgi:hypothetical protein
MMLFEVRKLLFSLFFFTSAFVWAQPWIGRELRFDIFVPTASISYDTLHADYSVNINFFTTQILDRHSKLGLLIVPFELQVHYEMPVQWSFFPVELIYNPVNYNELLWIYYYARAKVVLHDTRTPLQAPAQSVKARTTNAQDYFAEAGTRFEASFGVRFSLLPTAKAKRTYQPLTVSVFFEYSTRQTFLVGISLPAGGLSYVRNDWLSIISADIDAQIPAESTRFISAAR